MPAEITLTGVVGCFPRHNGSKSSRSSHKGTEEDDVNHVLLRQWGTGMVLGTPPHLTKTRKAGS